MEWGITMLKFKIRYSALMLALLFADCALPAPTVGRDDCESGSVVVVTKKIPTYDEVGIIGASACDFAPVGAERISLGRSRLLSAGANPSKYEIIHAPLYQQEAYLNRMCRLWRATVPGQAEVTIRVLPDGTSLDISINSFIPGVDQLGRVQNANQLSRAKEVFVSEIRKSIREFGNMGYWNLCDGKSATISLLFAADGQFIPIYDCFRWPLEFPADEEHTRIFRLAYLANAAGFRGTADTLLARENLPVQLLRSPNRKSIEYTRVSDLGQTKIVDPSSSDNQLYIFEFSPLFDLILSSYVTKRKYAEAENMLLDLCTLMAVECHSAGNE